MTNWMWTLEKEKTKRDDVGLEWCVDYCGQLVLLVYWSGLSGDVVK